MINYTLSITIVIFSLFSLKPCNSQLIYIPDDNFEQKLIDLGYDDELNDLVFQSTISSIQSLDISWDGVDDTQKINDITGIEAFLSLKTLVGDNNNINVDFDLSSLTELEHLSLKNNAISNLNVQQNTKLKYLDVGGNKFYDRDDYTTQWLCESTDISSTFSFDLSRNHLLETLIFNNYTRQNEDGFSLINVNIDGLTNLKYIDISCATDDFTYYTNFRLVKPAYYSNSEEDFPSESCSYENTCGETPICSGRGVTYTDLSINQELEYFNHKNTSGLYTQNISQNLKLKHYYAENTNSRLGPIKNYVNLETLELINVNIREIDLSENINLKNLNISGSPLEYLDLSSNPNLESVLIKGNSDNTRSAEFVALNLSSGANSSIVDLDITGNQNLACVVIDENFMPPATWLTSSAAAFTTDTSCFDQEKYFSTTTLSVFRMFDLFKNYNLDSRRIFVNAVASGHCVTRRGGSKTSIYNTGITSLNLDQYDMDVELIFFTFYKVINEANKIINYTNPVENPQNTQDENFNDAIGLAMFIRAYSYFYLARAFGDVPLHTEYMEGFDPYSQLGPVSQEDEVYQLVEHDTNAAIYYLNNSINAIFPDKFAAHMLMAKYFMHKNDWYAAKNHTQAIIDSGFYSLSANHNDLFTSPTSNNNNESIFEVKADTYDDYSNSISQFQRNFTPIKYSGGQAFGWLYANVDLFELHRLKYPNDARISSTYIHEYTSYDTGDTVRVYPSRSRGNFYTSFPYVLKFSRKPNSNDDPDDIYNRTQNNILYRYADVLLMHAEILNEIGDTNAAINYVSQVTERAGVDLHNDYFQGQHSFREAIMREYKFELAFEGEDFFNNRRRGYQWFIDHTITPHNTQLLNENGDAVYTHTENIDVVHNDLEPIIMKFALPTAYLQALSVDEVKGNNTIIAHPNPTTGLIKFDSTEIFDIEVFDLRGKKIMDDRGNQINIERLPSATYFIKISNGERSATIKFLKQ
jgi:hypothetical protein